MANPSKAHRTYQRRVLIIGLLLLGAIVIATSTALHRPFELAIHWASGAIEGHSAWGGVVFVILAALSAMLAFFSSVMLAPVAVDQWGNIITGVLLWVGWTLGGVAAYGVGRYMGRRVMRRFVSREDVAHYESRINAKASFLTILLVQSALPSEIPGYLLGTVRYPMGPYLLALAIAELPYAVGTVVLGNGFLHRQFWVMIVIGTLGLSLIAWAAALLKRTLE